MTGRLAWPGLVGAGFALAVACVRFPLFGLLLLVGGIATLLARRSPAIPLAVFSAATLPSLLLAGRLPQGFTVGAYGAWMALAILLAITGGRLRGVPVRRLVDASLLATAGLVLLLIIRLPPSPAHDYGSEKVQLTILILLLPYLLAILVGVSKDDIFLYFKIFGILGVATAIYSLYQLLAPRRWCSPPGRRSPMASCTRCGEAGTVDVRAVRAAEVLDPHLGVAPEDAAWSWEAKVSSPRPMEQLSARPRVISSASG